MINLLYCADSFQAKVKGKDTQKESGSLPKIEEFGEVKVAWPRGYDSAFAMQWALEHPFSGTEL